MPIDQTLRYTGTPFSWLTPYGLIGGFTMLSVFLLRGANFLTLKLDDYMHERARAAAIMVVILAISTYIYTDITIRIDINPGILPVAYVAFLLVTVYFIDRKMEGWAFLITRLKIILTQVAFLFPYS